MKEVRTGNDMSNKDSAWLTYHDCRESATSIFRRFVGSDRIALDRSMRTTEAARLDGGIAKVFQSRRRKVAATCLARPLPPKAQQAGGQQVHVANRFPINRIHKSALREGSLPSTQETLTPGDPQCITCGILPGLARAR